MFRSFVVGLADEIPPGTRRIVSVRGVGSIGVFNVRGEFFALKNVCPHQGGPLCLGRLTGTSRAVFRADEAPDLEWVRDGEILRCPWHAWEFDLRTGEAVFSGGQRVSTYAVRVTSAAPAGEPARAETYQDGVEEEMVVLELPIRGRVGKPE